MCQHHQLGSNKGSRSIPHLQPRTQAIHPTPGPDIDSSLRASVHVELQRPPWQDIACSSLWRGIDRARAAAAVGPMAAVRMADVRSGRLPGAMQDAAAAQGTRGGAAGEHGGFVHGHRAGVEPSLHASAESIGYFATIGGQMTPSATVGLQAPRVIGHPALWFDL